MRVGFRLLALLGALMMLSLTAGAETAPAATADPAATAEATEAPDASDSPAPGYVLVTTQNKTGWLPLPREGELSLPLKQVLPDGTECENIIHLTPTGVYMEESTCEGHDCVQQGEVTLENRKDRVLGNMIICLPNQVMLELYAPEELLDMMKKQPAESEK